jgi:hypothetical protein
MGIFDLLFGTGSRKNNYVLQETTDLIKREWEQIDIMVGQGGPSQLRQALIKADKTLDNALRDIVEGEKMGERLKNAKDKFDYATYDKIWKAHKMRNSLVHESGFEPPYHVIELAIDDLRRGLNKIGVTV